MRRDQSQLKGIEVCIYVCIFVRAETCGASTERDGEWERQASLPDMSRYGSHRLCPAAEATGLLVDSDKAEKVPSREERRRAQDEYRKELNVQVADTATRREQLRRRIREMEHQHELKSVRTLVHHRSY